MPSAQTQNDKPSAAARLWKSLNDTSFMQSDLQSVGRSSIVKDLVKAVKTITGEAEHVGEKIFRTLSPAERHKGLINKSH